MSEKPAQRKWKIKQPREACALGNDRMLFRSHGGGMMVLYTVEAPIEPPLPLFPLAPERPQADGK